MSGPADAAQVVFRPQPSPFGAILAGGASRRFGAPKAFARVAGVPLVERVRNAVCAAGLEPRLVTGDADLFAGLGLPSRPDAVPGAGPLAGVHAALRWAVEEGRPGVLCVSCDLPFLPSGLLREMCRLDPGALVVPESGGRAGVEPLCAFYPVGCLPMVEQHLKRGVHRLQDLLAAAQARRVPLARVREWGDPERIFFNVNTRADQQRADVLAGG